ncbi:MAG: hypothetical protein KC422_13875 [Trueperaceae bacterium]|nr:hypothetical protein [Trueperaceae bacterium]
MKYIIVLLISLASLALAQVAYKGELGLTSSINQSKLGPIGTGQFGFALRAHLEADYALDPLSFRLVVDPQISLNGSLLEDAFFEPGITEAYALYRLDSLDLSLGLERLPLEYARLSLPFGLEPTGKSGQRLGLLGIRGTFYLEDWRIRSALLYRYQDEQAGAIFSTRKAFGDFELEGHILYLNQEFVAGLGGSGLLGDLITYGEAWLRPQALNATGALGLSGFWGDSLWTLESAYAPSALLQSEDAFPQVLGQLSLPQGDNGSLELSSSLAYAKRLVKQDEQTLYAFLNGAYTFTELDWSLSTGASLVYSEDLQNLNLNLSFTQFF